MRPETLPLSPRSGCPEEKACRSAKKNDYIAYEPEAFLSDFSDRSASANGEASAAAVRTKPELSGLREAETAACVHTA